MNNSILYIAIISVFFASCSMNQKALQGGKVESDEVYYQPKDTYISDFALIDDEVKMESASQVPDSLVDKTAPSTDDDYYSGPGNTNGTVNNYYGTVNQSPWGNNNYNNGYGNYDYGNNGCGNNGYGNGGYNNNCGFGNYGFGSFSSWMHPQISIGWNPWSGWYTCFNFGYNMGGNQWYQPYNNYNYAWYSPYYNPWYYNQFGYNSAYSPYNYYNSYYGNNNPYSSGFTNGSGGSIGDVYAVAIHGHRNPLATGTAVNSTYGDDIFYSPKESKPNVGSQPSLAVGSQQIAPATLAGNQSENANSSTVKPTQAINSENVLLQSAVESHVETTTDQVNKPGIINNNQTGLFIPQMVASEKPRPTYTTDDMRQSDNESIISRTSSNSNENQQGRYQQPRNDNPSQRPWQQNENTGTRNPSTENRNPAQHEQPRYNEPARQNQSTPQTKPAGQPDKGSRGGYTPQTSGSSKGWSTPSGGSQKSGGNSSGGSISGPRRK